MVEYNATSARDEVTGAHGEDIPELSTRLLFMLSMSITMCA